MLFNLSDVPVAITLAYPGVTLADAQAAVQATYPTQAEAQEMVANHTGGRVALLAAEGKMNLVDVRGYHVLTRECMTWLRANKGWRGTQHGAGSKDSPNPVWVRVHAEFVKRNQQAGKAQAQATRGRKGRKAAAPAQVDTRDAEIAALREQVATLMAAVAALTPKS